jgi:hypothetical protein
LDTTPRIEGTSIDPGQSAVWGHAATGLHWDDVGPVGASPVAVAEQVRRDRFAVGLVADQDAVEVIAGLRENAPGFGAELNREPDATKPPANRGLRDPKRDNCRLTLR